MTDRCGTCKHWAPLLRERNFLGRCIAPDRPMERCTDRVDTCALFEGAVHENIVGRGKIEEMLE